MRKLILVLTIGLLCAIQSKGQTDVDALRYSQVMPTGTARSVAMGDAFGALGGDFSCLSMNPAGIGLFRRNDFTFTPSVLDMRTSSNYLGQGTDDSKYNVNISNIGYVSNHHVVNANPDGWQNWDFGIGYNRTANFSSNITFQGINTSNSLLDYFVQQASGTTPGNLDPFNAGLAYATYLINPLGNDSLNYNNVLPNHGEIQKMTINTTGGMGEMVISLGGNFANRLYIGATLGIDFINYNENSTYSETNEDASTPGFQSYTLNRSLNTSGTGVNVKMGMIYRANDFIRLGLAVHSPTFYDMHENYSASMTSNFDSANYSTGGGNYNPNNGSFDYNLTTPLRVIGSIAFILGQHGVLSGDYEYVDYSSAMLGDNNGTDFTDVNQTIATKYTQTSDIRVGTEWRFGGISLRAGYAFYGSPFASGSTPPNGANMTTTNYSVGLGLKDRAFSIDFGYIYSVSKQYYQPYTLNYETVQGATNTMQNNVFVMTLGYRFRG